MSEVDRSHFIEQGAEVTAQGMFAIRNGQPDPTGKMVGDKYELVPYLPMIETTLGQPAKRLMRIGDGKGNSIVLTQQEEIRLSALSTARLAVLAAQQGERN